MCHLCVCACVHVCMLAYSLAVPGRAQAVLGCAVPCWSGPVRAVLCHTVPCRALCASLRPTTPYPYRPCRARAVAVAVAVAMAVAMAVAVPSPCRCRCRAMRVGPCRFVPCCATAYRGVLSHSVAWRGVLWNAMPCRAGPCRSWCRAVPCRAMLSCHAGLCRAMLCRAMPGP